VSVTGPSADLAWLSQQAGGYQTSGQGNSVVHDQPLTEPLQLDLLKQFLAQSESVANDSTQLTRRDKAAAELPGLCGPLGTTPGLEDRNDRYSVLRSKGWRPGRTRGRADKGRRRSSLSPRTGGRASDVHFWAL